MGHARKQAISFFLTTRCNLDCRYCYTPKLEVRHEHQALDLRFAQLGIDDVCATNGELAIRFYGVGEPTLELGLMIDIHEYAARKAGRNLTVELQTNGVFSPQVRDWISDTVDILWISCDGPAECQDLLRPARNGAPSSPIVYESIEHFAARPNGLQLGVRATLTPATVWRQTELVELFHAMGVRNVSVEPASPVSGAGGRLGPSLAVDPLEFAQRFAEAYRRADELEMTYLSLTMVNFDEPVKVPCRSCVPCPQLTTDGYVSCCDYGMFGPEYLAGPLQHLIYGRYDRDNDRIVYDQKRIELIRSRCRVLAETRCSDCAVLDNCMGGCVGEAVNVTGDLYGIKKASCEATQELWRLLPRRREPFAVLHS